jgi:hypothetical protein
MYPTHLKVRLDVGIEIASTNWVSNQFHAQMVLDCDSNSKRLDVFKSIPWNQNLHQTSVFLMASESLPLHRRRPYHLHTLKSTGAHAGKLHPSMRRSLPFPHAANSRSIAHAREVRPLHTQVLCNRTAQFIRAQVQNQRFPAQFTYLNSYKPGSPWNHEGFQTFSSLQPRSYMIQ